MRIGIVSASVIFMSLVISACVHAKSINRRCPAAAEIEASINAKTSEMGTLDERIKVLKEKAKEKQRDEKIKKDLERSKKEAKRKMKMAEVKLKDPERYHLMVTEELERNASIERVRKMKSDERGSVSKESRQERYERIRKKNPELYDTMDKREKLRSEIKRLRLKLVMAQEACFNGK